MAERSHDGGDGKRVRDLVDRTKPGPDVRDVLGNWEVCDVVKKLTQWLYPVLRDAETKKIDLRGPELEFLWVEGAAAS